MPGWISDILLKIGEHLLPSLVRFFYKEQRFREQIKFSGRPEGDSVVWAGGELPYLRIWLHVTNLTPFDVTIDRVSGRATYGCQLAQFFVLERQKIPSASDGEMLVECYLSRDQIEMVKRQYPKEETQVSITAFVQSDVWNTEVTRSFRIAGVKFYHIEK
jgi:hypothetical protein